MINIFLPLCILLSARLMTKNIDLKESRMAYDELKKKYDSLLEEYL